MIRNSILSGEQALNDYFSALLDEKEELVESVPEERDDHDNEGSHDGQFIPKLEPVIEFVNQDEVALEVLPVPDLKDIEKLLDQLGSTNPVADIEHVEDIIEENTRKVVSDYHQHELSGKEESEPDNLFEEQHQEDNVQEGVDLKEIDVQAIDVRDNSIAVDIDEQKQFREASVTEGTDVSKQDNGSGGNDWNTWENVRRTSDFQVLYFDVNGVKFAVPLDELGGIHQIADLNNLIGRPKWYLGLQTNRENQLDVVDTARWVMANKLTDDSYKDDYQYIVMLGESFWGLACGELQGTELLDCDNVRWREQVGKRPWLAGMVKDKMCALIHVEALVAMLNAGLDVKALDK